MSTQSITTANPQTTRVSALGLMASRLNLEPERMKATLKATVFKECRNDEELAALVVVANEYGLNPLLKEIHAFPAKGGGIVPMIPVDGWVKMVNRHDQMDGLEFDDHENEKGEIESITCTIWRKDRTRPIKVTEYLVECVRNTEPWKMKRRMLRHKALMQCARYAFGFSGIHDEDEAVDIANNGGMREANGRTVDDNAAEQPARRTRGSRAAITDTQAPEAQQEQPAEPERSQADIEKEEKQNLLNVIRETFNEFEDVNESKFEGMCRKLGLMAPTSMLPTLSLAKLRVIHDNRGDIIRGEYKADGGE